MIKHPICLITFFAVVSGALSYFITGIINPEDDAPLVGYVLACYLVLTVIYLIGTQIKK